ncbi:MAG TPA: GMC family oxidoreductase N-terminal domain-containing protein [Candidatus Limnocylindria bacterium]|nr:GMC family oxidoreductase N-terminal domain-containing protein [Candidatus Limnocylindria bacterium]
MTRDEGAHGWSPSLVATLADVFATFVPGSEADAPRRASLAAETLDATADHDELRLLKLAIASLEVPAANLASAAVWGRFSRLERRDRERILQAWARHPVPRLRTAFQALKRLALFLAFADDGGTNPPHNQLWSRIGYEPASPPEAAPSPALRPIALDRTPGATVELEADCVVVGSGAGGGVVAARLAEAGLAVLVLEAGPFMTEAELPRTEGAAFRDLYLDRGTTATADLGVTILAGSGVGGGTTINWTTSLAPPDWLRAEWATTHGLDGFDGAEADDDLARLSRELDLQPPSIIPRKDQLILDGAARLGWEAGPSLRNAGPCTDCGACGFGCPYGHKRAGTRAHLASACAAGARLVARAVVDGVTISGGSVMGVRGRLLPDQAGNVPRPFTVRTGSVVVAAGALRTPLILRASGLGHGQLGRNLRLHPVVAIAARLPDPVDAWLGPTQAARSLEWCRPGPAAADGAGPAHGGFVIESAPPHPGLTASALPWESGAREMALMDEIRQFAPLIALIRDQGAGRVHWSRGGHPRIEYRVSAADGDTARRALVEMARLGRAAGATRLLVAATPPLWWSQGDGGHGFERFLRSAARLSTSPNRVSFFSAHQMGTARSGADPRAHPCDPHGRVRADVSGALVPGLYVGDASLFPSASGVNPMLAVMVLAERTARAVLADHRAGLADHRAGRR